MSKIFKIYRCIDGCPYFTFNKYRHGWKCYCTLVLKDIEQVHIYNTVPEWCPLPDK